MKPEPGSGCGLIGFCGFFPGFFLLGLSGSGFPWRGGFLTLAGVPGFLGFFGLGFFGFGFFSGGMTRRFPGT
jgi:hypothetical protein